MDTGLAILESRKSTTASVLGKIVADISAGDLEQSTIDAFMNDDAAKFLAPRLTLVINLWLIILFVQMFLCRIMLNCYRNILMNWMWTP